MKKFIIYSGIALVVFANISNTTFETKSVTEASKKVRKEVVVNKGKESFLSKEIISKQIKSKSQRPSVMNLKSLYVDNFSGINEIEIAKNTMQFESIKSTKNADELIAKDNAITENNISNETFALNFDIINGNKIVFEIFDIENSNHIEESPDQLIAEDNAVTENNISNETQALDFELLNRN